MNRFNLSEWAIRNKILVLYFMIAAAMAGAWAYGSIGRE
jgi:multidrug efflux pump subunit AcrB